MDDFFDLDGRGGGELEVLRKFSYANIGQPGVNKNSLGQIYFLKFLKERPDDFIATLSVKTMTLRGSGISGQHQELMVECHSGIYIRISRNNSSDTFQIGAEPTGERQLPVLETKSPCQAYSGVKLFEVFNKYHDHWSRYEQADCHIFAQAIMKEVSGIVAVSKEDDFM